MEDQQEQVIPQSFVLFLPQLWPERELWGIFVCNQSLRKQVCSQKQEACSQDPFMQIYGSA